MSDITPFINPVEWIKAWQFNRKNARFDKSTYDLELHLYSKILNSNMLHWGYFTDPNVKPEDISLSQVEEAQHQYARNILEHVVKPEEGILDVGCGMGGLAEQMMERNWPVEVLTPNANQLSYIGKNHPDLVAHRCKFEQFKAEKKFGTVINSESLQYISLADAFRKLNEIVLPGGRWIVVDYFRTDETKPSRRPHLLSDFKQKLEENGWKILEEKDITAHVLPTIAFVNMYIDRFLLPAKHYGYEKLRYKKGWLFYLTSRLRATIDRKLERERKVVHPELFVQEKKYVFFVLEKQ